MHIHGLRAAVDKPFATPLIQTRHGIGYRIAAPDARTRALQPRPARYRRRLRSRIILSFVLLGFGLTALFALAT